MPRLDQTDLSDAPVYRAYSIGQDGSFFGCDVIVALNDADAVLKAHALNALYPLDLWERARFLGRITAAATSGL